MTEHRRFIALMLLIGLAILFALFVKVPQVNLEELASIAKEAREAKKRVENFQFVDSTVSQSLIHLCDLVERTVKVIQGENK